MAIDTSNHLLLGFANGIVQMMIGTNFITLIQDTNFKGPINCILPQNPSLFWVATDSSGLIRCNYLNGYSVYDTINSSIPSNTIKDIQADHLHRIWLATYGKGIAMFDGITWTVYNSANSGLPENYTNTITFGPDSSLWIGLPHKGITVMKNNSWSNYTTCTAPLSSFGSINKLRTGPDGRIYLGGGGVNVITVDYITTHAGTIHSTFHFCAIPNPASGQVSFEVGSHKSTEPRYFEIFSTLGNKVYSAPVSPGSESVQCNIVNFARGIYFAVLKGVKDQVKTTKFVVY